MRPPSCYAETMVCRCGVQHEPAGVLRRIVMERMVMVERAQA
jgi:hypothetical protein